MKSSWQIIKEFMTRDATPRSIGYYFALANAADLFVSLADSVKDKANAIKEFNEEPDIAKVISIRSMSKDFTG